MFGTTTEFGYVPDDSDGHRPADFADPFHWAGPIRSTASATVAAELADSGAAADGRRFRSHTLAAGWGVDVTASAMAVSGRVCR